MSFPGSYIANWCSIARGRQPLRPLLFSYYVTHRCDLNCRYCCDGDGKRFKADPVPELDLPQVKSLLRILRRAATTLDITGGEPMVREDLESILAEAKARGFRTVLNTKGVGLPQRRDLLRFTDVLVLSIDSLEPETLASAIGRPVDVAGQVLAALRFAMEHRGNTRLVLSSVATPDNLSQVAQVRRFALEKGLMFHLSPEILGTRVNPALRGNGDYRRLIDDTLAAKRTGHGVLGLPEYLEGIRDFRSFACHPLLMPTVRPDGRMYYPCLESRQARVDLLAAGSYRRALAELRRAWGEVPACHDCCHLFCHMALSLYQRHPLSALGEWKHWRN